MIPAAREQCKRGPDNIRENVEGIEVAAVGQEGLKDFGADAQSGGDDYEGDVYAASAGGFGDPVERHLREQREV